MSRSRGVLTDVSICHVDFRLGTPVCFFCPICRSKEPMSSIRGKRRPVRQTPEFYYTRLADVAQERGGKLLSPSYLGSRAKHAFECGQGHQWEASATNVLSGSWCLQCSAMNEKERRTLTMKDMHDTAAYFGGVCLSQEYRGSQGKLRWRCKEGHVFEKAPNNIRRRVGRRGGVFCSICHRRDKEGTQPSKSWKDAPQHPLPLPRKGLI